MTEDIFKMVLATKPPPTEHAIPSAKCGAFLFHVLINQLEIGNTGKKYHKRDRKNKTKQGSYVLEPSGSQYWHNDTKKLANPPPPHFNSLSKQNKRLVGKDFCNT